MGSETADSRSRANTRAAGRTRAAAGSAPRSGDAVGQVVERDDIELEIALRTAREHATSSAGERRAVARAVGVPSYCRGS